MISPYRIKYAGIASNDLNIPDLITCVSMDSDNGETPSFLNRESVASESHNGRYKRIHSMKYTETFSPKMTFMKSNFEEFSIEDVRSVMKWLTMKDTTALLEVYYDDSNVVTWASIGGFVELQTYKLANNRTIAITAVWDSISPFALSDLYTRNQNVSTRIDTTMYYWTANLVSGFSVPQYLLTTVQTPVVGDAVYYTPSKVLDTIISSDITIFGAISAVNEDGSYIVNDTSFTLTPQGTKIKRSYNNKIVINIDTDDNKPVYPRIIINHGYGTPTTPHSVVNIPPSVQFSNILDMTDYVENTVYYNGTTYYWKTSETVFRSDSVAPAYKEWKIIEAARAYTEEDSFEANTFYHYNGVYYWLDPYSFHSSQNDPSLNATSVKITNTHYDVWSEPTVLPSVIVKNNSPTETVTLDGANKIVSSSNTRRIYGDDFNWQWLELYDGMNEITVLGNCEVMLEYRTVIKCGEY